MLDILWPDLDQYLSLDELSYSASDISLHIATTAPNASCPVCQLPSTNVHSHYQRSLCDLPVAGLAVRIQLRVRRFFCCADDCPRRIFVERLSALTRPYAHRTTP
jgi:transposase